MKQRVGIRLDEDYRYRLQDEAAIEDFEDGSLLFLGRQLGMIKLNPAARRVLAGINGRAKLRDVIRKLARELKTDDSEIRVDVHRLVESLIAQDAVRPVVRVVIEKRRRTAASARLMANPLARQEDESEDGASLFLPGREAPLVLNAVGLEIWRYVRSYPRAESEIVDYIKTICRNVPRERLEKDVAEFVGNLKVEGFVGVAKPATSLPRKSGGSSRDVSAKPFRSGRQVGMLLHASSVEVGGKALVFLGHSSSGKSTIGRLLSAKYTLIADDKVSVYRGKSGAWLIKKGMDAFLQSEEALRAAQGWKSYPLSAVLRIYKSRTLDMKPLSPRETCRYLLDAVFEIDVQRKCEALEARKTWFSTAAALAKENKGLRLTFRKDKSIVSFVRASFEAVSGEATATLRERERRL